MTDKSWGAQQLWAGCGRRLLEAAAAFIVRRRPPPARRRRARPPACLPRASGRRLGLTQAAAASFSGGGRRGRCIARAAAAVRPTLKRDTSTVLLDAAHVHRSVGLKLGVHTGIAITHRPRAKKGAVAA
jgi:hypothetical protein